MNTDKKVAIVVVTYNRLKLLLQAIDALLKQTYTNADILIINNASTDETEETLKPYAQRGEAVPADLTLAYARLMSKATIITG